MNLKRISVILLAGFLLAGLCCGAASAFIVEKEAAVNPSTSLAPGDKVTAVLEIKLPKGSVDSASKISFDSPLAGDTWVVDIIKGNTIVNTKHPASPYLYLSGFDLDYDSSITLKITVSGTVSSVSLGKEISVLQITALGMHDLGIQSYSSPKQKVNGAAEPRTTLTPTPTQKETSEISNQNKVFLITKEAVIIPSDSLVSGEKVTATVEIKLPKGTVDTAGKVLFDSPLAGDTWVVDIIKGNTIVNTKHPASPYLYLSGFDLDYDADIILRISVTGTVSSESSNKEISVLKVTASDMNTGTQSYISPKQFVSEKESQNDEIIPTPTATTEIKPTTEPTQPEKQEYSDEFQKFIRALIAWLESLIS